MFLDLRLRHTLDEWQQAEGVTQLLSRHYLLPLELAVLEDTICVASAMLASVCQLAATSLVLRYAHLAGV